MEISTASRIRRGIADRFRGARPASRSCFIIAVDEVRTTVAHVRAGRVSCCESLPTAPAGAEADTPAIGNQSLGDLLQRMGGGTSQAIMIAGRESVVLRRLSIPTNDEDEARHAIRLQVESLSPFPMEETLSDWIELDAGADGSRTFLLGMMNRGTLEQICRTAEEAGLEPTHVVLGELAVTACSPMAGSGAGIGYHFAAKSGRPGINIIVSDAGRTVASQQLLVSGDSQTDALRLQGLLRRLHRSLPEEMASRPVAGAEAVGLVPEACLAAAGEVLGVPVTPSATDADHEVADRVLNSLESPRTFNFAQPRGSVRPRRRLPTRLIQWTAIVLTGVTSLLYWARLEASDRESREARLQAQLEGLEAAIDHGQSILGEAAMLADWASESADWREELPPFLECYEESDRLRILSLHMSTSSRDGLPVVRVRGAAKDSSDVSELTQRLIRHARGYELSPPVVEPRRDDPSFSASFEIEATLRRSPSDRQQEAG